MLQSRVNGTTALAASGQTIEAAESAGVLTLTSKRWGSASSVSLTGGNATATLFGTASSTAAVDAAGSIGGTAAVGSGQNLTGKGLTVTIDGGATGARGTLGFTRGVTHQLSTLIDDMLKVTITARTSGLQKSIKDIASRKDAFEGRMVKREASMRAQFVALDSMLSSMQNTSSYLTRQLANLPKAGA